MLQPSERRTDIYMLAREAFGDSKFSPRDLRDYIKEQNLTDRIPIIKEHLETDLDALVQYKLLRKSHSDKASKTYYSIAELITDNDKVLERIKFERHIADSVSEQEQSGCKRGIHPLAQEMRRVLNKEDKRNETL
jgi:DNA-binding HxlR family transcriptional regulator